jgi:hypothetical protein
MIRRVDMWEETRPSHARRIGVADDRQAAPVWPRLHISIEMRKISIVHHGLRCQRRLILRRLIQTMGKPWQVAMLILL